MQPFYSADDGQGHDAVRAAVGRLRKSRARRLRNAEYENDTLVARYDRLAGQNASLIYSRATKNIKGGEIVLMHPMKETADALDDILTYYETCSLRAVTVSENLQDGG